MVRTQSYSAFKFRTPARVLGLLCLLVCASGCARVGAGNLLGPFLFPGSLVSLSIQGSSTMEVGTTTRLTATGTYSSGSMLDLTDRVEWSSDNTAIAAVANTADSRGLVTPAASGTTSIRVTSETITGEFSISVTADLTGPEVTIVTALNNSTARVIFSEAVGTTQAQTISNYVFADGTGSGSCADNSNYTGSAATGDFTITAASCTSNYCDLTLSATPTANKAYTLFANKATLKDTAPTANSLGCPNSAGFVGQEQLKPALAQCSSTTQVVLTFSKPVRTGVNTDRSAECSTPVQCALRYSMTGVTAVGDIQSVQALDGTNCGGQAADPSGTRFCLTHQNAQTGGQYTILFANNIDGDGFDNLGCGWATSCSIRDSGDSENIQMLNNDRLAFSGCGTTPTTLGGGPLTSDNFGDSTSFGYLTLYNNKIYIGPNQNGNAVTRFNADSSNPFTHSFEFARDTSTANSSGSHANSATTRDGGTAVPPYVTIGHTGCTANNADISTGCGPNNENGRGLFTSGTLNGTEYLFLTGVVTGGNNDYVYYTSDTDNILNFSYVDMQAPLDLGDDQPNTGNRGVESLHAFNNRLYVVQPGDNEYRPYIVKLNNLNAESQNNVSGVWLRLRFMTGFAQFSGTKPNYGDRLGATVHSFNDRIYMANSGSVRDNTNGDYNCPEGNTSSSVPACINDGGLIRSQNNDPGRCNNAPDDCPDWVDITPSSAEFQNYFSKILEATTDLIPSQRPFPAFATFNNNVYMIRNACTTNMINRGCNGAACTDDGDPANGSCPAGNEVPQLWKCVPGVDGHCDSADWSLVAENGTTDRTNFGDVNNNKLSLLVVNGPYLYVGFDNVNGIQVWRTLSGVTNPASASDFEQIGGNGLGDTTNNREIYSATSVTQNLDHYLFVSTGQNSTPVKIYQQKDN